MIWPGAALDIVSETVTQHPFEAWLRSKRYSKEWAAAELQLSRGTLHRYFTGARLMDPAAKLKVQLLTGSDVPAIEICRWELDRTEKAAA